MGISMCVYILSVCIVKYVCIHAHTHTHIYVYIYKYAYIYMHIIYTIKDVEGARGQLCATCGT